MATSGPSFSIFALVRRNVRYYRRSNLAVVLGCAVAVAALVGSLLVGDSVRGTLRGLALERLGRVHYALQAQHFFREELAGDVLRHPEVAESVDVAVPAIIIEGAVANASTGAAVPRAAVLGITDDFLLLGSHDLSAAPEGRRVVLNRTLAADLGVSPGDFILLNVGAAGDAPADSIFARRTRRDTLRTMRLEVGRVIPDRGLGAFSLRQDQAKPRHLYVSLSWLQARLDRKGMANTILMAPGTGSRATPVSGERLKRALAGSAQLADYALRLVPNTARGYLSLEADRLLLRPGTVELTAQTAREAGMRPTPTSVYLANSLSRAGDDADAGSVPYSTVASLTHDAQPPFGPLPLVAGTVPGPLGPDDIVLNAWAAEDLAVGPGDRIRVTCYRADDTGALATVERTFALRAVVAMQGPALDPGVVPTFRGITDAATMRNWDPPFPIDLKRIRPKDETYWEEHRATPKAFFAPETLRELWSPAPERWITSVRIGLPGGVDLDSAAERLTAALVQRVDPAEFGLDFQPIREDALRAARGSSDFGILFLSMSMFLVAAAAGLVGLLLRLTIERRASQCGILMAVGFPARKVARVLMAEGLLLAVLGVGAGVPLGIGYAALIIRALRTFWSGAAANFTFSLHVTPASVVTGAGAGFAVAALALYWALRGLRKSRPSALLGGWRGLSAEPRPALRRWSRVLAALALVLSVALLGLAAASDSASPTGAFFGGGSLLLVGLLALLCAHFQRPLRVALSRGVSTWGLGWRAASRNWLRSLLTCGLVACASFVVVAVAANRRDLARLNTRLRDSPAGGFPLVARSTVPIHADLNSSKGREDLAFSPDASHALADTTFYPFRLSAGDDISCLNIQQPARPQILGVPPAMVRRGGFTFAKYVDGPTTVSGMGLSINPPSTGSPWQLLDWQLPEINGETWIPAFADAASAQWILHLGLGDTLELTNSQGEVVRLMLVGLLSNSIFQGELLVADSQFRKHFGADVGHRYFLIDSPPGREDAVAETLRRNLGEQGFDVRRTADVLADFARVQNTYLATFQTLGGLGLLLGTFGIVTVLLRGVVERRSELAMLLALGLSRRQIAGIIVVENGLLLLLGVLAGSVAALVAVAPHLVSALADVNWLSLAGTLLVTVAVGLVSCAISAAVSVKRELLAALRSE